MSTPSQISLGAKGRWLGVAAVCSSLPVSQPSATFWDFSPYLLFSASWAWCSQLSVSGCPAHSGNGEGKKIFLSPTKFRNVLSFHTHPPSFVKKKQTNKKPLCYFHSCMCASLCDYLPASEPEEGFTLLGARDAGLWEQPGWCWELNPSIPHRWPALQPPKHPAFMWVSCCCLHTHG